MSSFYAELHLDGQRYPVVHCSYEVFQGIDPRGRATSKVRHGRVQLRLDVPDSEQLLTWAAATSYPLDGDVVFYDPASGSARETLHFTAGECVAYEEEFDVGDRQQGAYRCLLTVATAKLSLQAGGPAQAYVPPAPRAYAPPRPEAVAAVAAGAATAQLVQALRKNDADPVHDLLGPGRLSHPQEWQQTLDMLKQEGVRVVFRAGVMAYGPDATPGFAGQLILDPEASIGALRHEKQHYLDDKALGFPGSAALYKNPQLRWQMEYAAYMQEIALARELKAFPTGFQLVGNAREEKKYIQDNFGSF